MNWIFEAYASVYQTATGIGRDRGSNAATAKNRRNETSDDALFRR